MAGCTADTRQGFGETGGEDVLERTSGRAGGRTGVGRIAMALAQMEAWACGGGGGFGIETGMMLG